MLLFGWASRTGAIKQWFPGVKVGGLGLHGGSLRASAKKLVSIEIADVQDDENIVLIGPCSCLFDLETNSIKKIKQEKGTISYNFYAGCIFC